MKKVIKASAGTGKTYRLSLEYLAALLSGQKFSEIVVLTFTRKATAEARERILTHLEELREEGEESQVWLELSSNFPGIAYDYQLLTANRHQMLLHKDKIQIYTIDSFINSLFRQLIAPYLGLYDYDIVDEEKEDEIISEVFQRLLSSEKSFVSLEKLLQIRVARNYQRTLNFLQEIVAQRWKFMMIDRDNRTPYQNLDYLPPFEQSLQVIRKVAEQKDLSVIELTKKDFQEEINSFLKLKKRGATKGELETNLMKSKDKFTAPDSYYWNGNRVTGEDKDRAKAHYQNFQDQLAKQIFNQEIIPIEDNIFNLKDMIFKEYDRLKFKRGVFTHDDISNYVYKYLVQEDLLLTAKNLPELLEELTGNKISSLFIDEFQDTSVLQWKILGSLIEKNQDSSFNFVAVGDAKQSIYGWRGGEKELFHRLPELLTGSVREDSLSVCYRSDREIINFINDFFAGLHEDWKYDRVKAAPGAEEGYVKVRLGGRRAKIAEDTKTFQNYGVDLQQKIRRQNKEVIEDLPRAIATTLKEEFISYKDVAVLARSGNDLGKIASKLDEVGVDYIWHQERKLLENRAVEPLHQLLLFFWQNDYHSLMNFLRSDLVKLPQTDLKFLLRHKKEMKKLWDRAIKEEELIDYNKLLLGKNSLKELFEWLVDIYTSSYRKLAYRLITESGCLTCWQDQAARKNIYRFYSLMRQKDSLAQFMEFCREENLEEAVIQNDNAVDLLTIHKAKGLSLHTVLFYWNITGGRGGNREEELEFYLNFSEDYQQIEDYLLTTDNYDNLLDWLNFPFKEQQEKENLQEEINNIYVALTRAKHNLFLWIDTSSKIKPDEKEAWKNKSESYNFYESNIKQACAVDSLAELIPGIERGTFKPPERITTAEKIVLTDVGSFFRPHYQIKDRLEELKAEKRDITLTLSRERERMTGLAIHYYLEHIYQGGEEEKKTARRQTLAKYGNILGDELIAHSIKRAENFIADNPRYFSANWEVFNEYKPSSQEFKTEEQEKTGGRIDKLLLNREQKKIVILDYKSGESSDEEQLKRYRKMVREEVGDDFEIRVEFLHL